MATALDDALSVLGNRYRIDRELGRGNVGAVYLAHDPQLNRWIALRLVPVPAGITTEVRDYMVQKARLAVGLPNPNVLSINSVEELDGWLLFTMDYLSGETLQQRVERAGPIPVGEATRILRDTANAVSFARAYAGLVHGNLRPDNIIIERGTGRVVVMDFGVPRWRLPDESGNGGWRFSTPTAYMAPELIRGAPPNQHSDVYALGITGYFLVTGFVPFDGDTDEEIIEKHLTQPVPPLAVLNRHLDNTYSRVVRRCLEKDPKQRPFGAVFLIDLLARAPELGGHDLAPDLDSFAWATRLMSINAPSTVLLDIPWLAFAIYGIATVQWDALIVSTIGLYVFLFKPAWSFFRQARALLGNGRSQEDLVRAMKVDLERERYQIRFRYLPQNPTPSRIAGRIAYAALTLAAFGAVLMVRGVRPTLAVSTFIAGSIVALIAGWVGSFSAPRNLDLAGELWLKFFKGPLGALFVKLASIGLDINEPKGPEPRPLEEIELEARLDLINQIPASEHLAASRIKRIADCLNAAERLDAKEAAGLPPERADLLWALTRASLELQKVTQRLRAVRVKDSREYIAAQLKAVRLLAYAADQMVSEWNGMVMK